MGFQRKLHGRCRQLEDKIDDLIIDIYKELMPKFDGPSVMAYDVIAHKIERALENVCCAPVLENV